MADIELLGQMTESSLCGVRLNSGQKNEYDFLKIDFSLVVKSFGELLNFKSRLFNSPKLFSAKLFRNHERFV